MSLEQIDRTKIEPPKVELSNEAEAQLRLMSEFDPTLEGKIFRFTIDGKGCDGFSYACGFDDKREGDFLVTNPSLANLQFAFDPFAARYMTIVQLDFTQDFKENTEGFVITNLEQANYTGKFWKKDPTKRLALKSED